MMFLDEETEKQKYCGNCGNTYDNDETNYCGNCGQKRDSTNCSQSSQGIVTNKRPSLLKGIILVLIIIGLFVFAIKIINSCTQDNTTAGNVDGLFNPTVRSATVNDIEEVNDFGISTKGFNVHFTPKENIKGLEIAIIFYKKNGTVYKTDVKYIGNVSKNSNQTVTYSLEETAIILVYATSLSVNVTGGTVSLI